jgi:hypothetical protein
MPTFRKKPVLIEAVQLVPENHSAAIDLAARSQTCSLGPFYGDDGEWQTTVHTPEGTMFADRGDWLILGVQGELYPCKPDIFAATYDPAD